MEGVPPVLLGAVGGLEVEGWGGKVIPDWVGGSTERGWGGWFRTLWMRLTTWECYGIAYVV